MRYLRPVSGGAYHVLRGNDGFYFNRIFSFCCCSCFCFGCLCMVSRLRSLSVRFLGVLRSRTRGTKPVETLVRIAYAGADALFKRSLLRAGTTS